MNFKCDFCGCSFPNKWNRDRHVKSNTKKLMCAGLEKRGQGKSFSKKKAQAMKQRVYKESAFVPLHHEPRYPCGSECLGYDKSCYWKAKCCDNVSSLPNYDEEYHTSMCPELCDGGIYCYRSHQEYISPEDLEKRAEMSPFRMLQVEVEFTRMGLVFEKRLSLYHLCKRLQRRKHLFAVIRWKTVEAEMEILSLHYKVGEVDTQQMLYAEMLPAAEYATLWMKCLLSGAISDTLDNWQQLRDVFHRLLTEVKEKHAMQELQLLTDVQKFIYQLEAQMCVAIIRGARNLADLRWEVWEHFAANVRFHFDEPHTLSGEYVDLLYTDGQLRSAVASLTHELHVIYSNRNCDHTDESIFTIDVCMKEGFKLLNRIHFTDDGELVVIDGVITMISEALRSVFEDYMSSDEGETADVCPYPEADTLVSPNKDVPCLPIHQLGHDNNVCTQGAVYDEGSYADYEGGDTGSEGGGDEADDGLGDDGPHLPDNYDNNCIDKDVDYSSNSGSDDEEEEDEENFIPHPHHTMSPPLISTLSKDFARIFTETGSKITRTFSEITNTAWTVLPDEYLIIAFGELYESVKNTLAPVLIEREELVILQQDEEVAYWLLIDYDSLGITATVVTPPQEKCASIRMSSAKGDKEPHTYSERHQRRLKAKERKTMSEHQYDLRDVFQKASTEQAAKKGKSVIGETEIDSDIEIASDSNSTGPESHNLDKKGGHTSADSKVTKKPYERSVLEEAYKDIHDLRRNMLSKNLRISKKFMRQVVKDEVFKVVCVRYYIQLMLDNNLGRMNASYACAKANYRLKDGKEGADSIYGYKARLIRKWGHEFIIHKEFRTSGQGMHVKTMSVITDEQVQVQLRNVLQGMNALDRNPFQFQTLLNEQLLSQIKGAPRKVSLKTARRWMKLLGYTATKYKKGYYVDGHERDDVRAAREVYLAKMAEKEQRMRDYEREPTDPDPSNLLKETPPSLKDGEREVILITHDESIFYSNDATKLIWILDQYSELRPKSNGSSIHVSAFVNERSGLPKEAYKIIYPGKNRDGFWTNKDLAEQLQEVLQLYSEMYPDCDFLFQFDNSANHGAFKDDALVASRLNLKVGAKSHDTVDGDGNEIKSEYKMRDTYYTKDGKRIRQSMIDPISGRNKGIIPVLSERGLCTRDGKRLHTNERLYLDCEKCKCGDTTERPSDCCARRLLANQPDFLGQKNWLQEIVDDWNTTHGSRHSLIFLPKFHCELNWIEMVWGYVKARLRRDCMFSFAELKMQLPKALQSIPLSTMRKFARHCFRYMSAYRVGLEGQALEHAQKLFSSHRKIPSHVNIDFILDKLERSSSTLKQKEAEDIRRNQALDDIVVEPLKVTYKSRGLLKHDKPCEVSGCLSDCDYHCDYCSFVFCFGHASKTNCPQCSMSRFRKKYTILPSTSASEANVGSIVGLYFPKEDEWLRGFITSVVLPPKGKSKRKMRMQLIGIKKNKVDTSNDNTVEFSASPDLYGSSWVLLEGDSSIQLPDGVAPWHPAILAHHQKYSNPPHVSISCTEDVIGARVQALYKKDWFFGILTQIVDVTTKGTSIKKYKVKFDDNIEKVLEGEKVRRIPACDVFVKGTKIMAMWCGMGDQCKNSKGRRSTTIVPCRVLVESQLHWAKGTIVDVMEDDHGNCLYECRFLDRKTSEEELVTYILYGEYVIRHP